MQKYSGEVLPLQKYDGEVLPLDDSDKENIVKKSAQDEKLNAEIQSNTIPQEASVNPVLSEEEDPYRRTAHNPQSVSEALKQTGFGNIAGAAWNAAKNVGETVGAGISGTYNYLTGAEGDDRSDIAGTIERNVPSYEPDTPSAKALATPAEIGVGMLVPATGIARGAELAAKAPVLRAAPKAVEGLFRYLGSIGSGVAATDAGTDPIFLNTKNAELKKAIEENKQDPQFNELMDKMAFLGSDENGNFSDRLLEEKIKLFAENAVIAKPAEWGARGVAGVMGFAIDQTLGRAMRWRDMTAKERQTTLDMAEQMVDTIHDPFAKNADKAKGVSDLADKIERGTKVNIPSETLGIDDVDHSRTTMGAYVKGSGDELTPLDRARAAGFESEIVAKGAPKTSVALDKPNAEISRVQDQTRTVFGGDKSVEKARSGIHKSFTDDISNVDQSIKNEQNRIEAFRKSSDDVIKQDPFLGSTVNKADTGNVQIDIGNKVNDTTDKIVEQAKVADKARTKRANELYNKNVPANTKADMKSFNKVLEEVDPYIPAPLKDIISKNDGTIRYLDKRVLPDLQRHIDTLDTGSNDSFYLRKLRDNISKTQEKMLEARGVNVENRKIARRNYIENVAPYRQGTVDNLRQIDRKLSRKRPDEAAVLSRAEVKSTLDAGTDKIEYTKRLFSSLGNSGNKLKGDYVLGKFGEEFSDAVAEKGIDGIDRTKMAQTFRKYLPLLDDTQKVRAQSFIKRIEDKNTNLEKMKGEFDTFKKQAEDSKKILENRSTHFKDQDGAIQKDGDQVFGEYLKDNKNPNRVTELISRAEKTDTMKGLKASYSKAMNRIFKSTGSASGARDINEQVLKNIKDGTDPLFKYGDQIYGKDSDVMKMYRGLADESELSGMYKGAKKVSMTELNRADKEARASVDFVVTQIWGPLSRVGSRVRSGVGKAIDSVSAKQMMLDARDEIGSDPEKAVQYLRDLSKEYNLKLEPHQRNAVFRWLVLSKTLNDNDSLHDQTDKALTK